MTPLHYECASSALIFFEHVIVLLDANEDNLILKDNHGRTHLKLLSNAASIPDEKRRLHYSLHHSAASSDSLSEKSLLFLVNSYPDSVQTASKDGMLPFHYACLNQVLSFEDLMIFLSLHPEAVAF